MANSLIIALALILLNVTPLRVQNTAQPTSHESNAAAGNKKSLIGAQLELGQPQQAPAQKKDGLAANDNEKWVRWGVYINGALALATFVLAIFAVFQAEAAKRMADAMVKSERPWIFVRFDSPNRFDIPKQSSIYFNGRNEGRTPAKITRMSVTYYPQDQNAEFPVEPPYEKTELIYPKYIGSKEPFAIESFNLRLETTAEMWEEMNKRKERLLFIGHIVYFDLIMEQEHETRFCYFLSPNPRVGLVMTGPRHYNQHT